jgi:hypothetical protein
MLICDSTFSNCIVVGETLLNHTTMSINSGGEVSVSTCGIACSTRDDEEEKGQW